MRRILTAGCLVLLCLGCDSGVKRVAPRPPARVPAPRCDLAVLWNGVRYNGRKPVERPIHGHKLGVGGVPSCPDVLGGETGASRAVVVRTLVGVDPGRAVTIAGDDLHVYVAGRP
jgi:hypothetical protein